MRILIYSINFSPELTGAGKYTGEMVEWLALQGHGVRVVTAPPYYPQWRVSVGYSNWWGREEVQGARDKGQGANPPQPPFEKKGGVMVYRCPLWIPSKPSGLKRLLHLASYAISSFPVMLGQTFWRPDVVWIVEPTLFCVPGGLLISKLSGSSSWLHVQDFEVDAAFDLDLLLSPILRRLINKAEDWLMHRFDRVSTITPSMVKRLHKKHIHDDAIRLFPNWVDTDLIRPLEALSLYRKKLRFSDHVIVVLYSGNMGNKQGLEILTAAAKSLQNRSDLTFVFCGDGTGREKLISETANLPNVVFLPLQPLERLNDLLNLADIHLLPQKAGAVDLVMPSKLTGMLASGRPVVATAKHGTQLAEVVQGKGIVVNPDDGEALANAIVLLADDASLRRKLGTAAREYAVTHLGKEAILTEFERSLFELVNKRHCGAERL